MNTARTVAIVCALGLAGLSVLGFAEESQFPRARFPHEFHYDTLEVECEQCHHETNAAKLEIPHEEYFTEYWAKCKTCHREVPAAGGPQPCSSCHHNSPTDVADETLSAKVVIHRSCWVCHEVGRGAEAAAACKTCHVEGGEA